MSLTRREFQPITRATIPDSLDFGSFASTHLQDVDPYAMGNIELAFGMAVGAHKNQTRDSGEPFLAHPVMCTIYYREVGGRRPSVIIGNLLHDVPEDNIDYLLQAQKRISEATDRFIPGDPEFDYNMPEHWELTELGGGTDLLTRQFGLATSQVISAVTKEPIRVVTGKEWVDKKIAERKYRRQLREASSEAWLVKACDRLHNLRTLPNDPHRIRRKIDETREGYIPIFEMAARTHPIEGGRLLWLIEEELAGLEAGLSKTKVSA